MASNLTSTGVMPEWDEVTAVLALVVVVVGETEVFAFVLGEEVELTKVFVDEEEVTTDVETGM